jgi:hypothetical protein
MLRFAYRLGWRFGKLNPVRDILFEIDRRGLAYWMAFLQLEPAEADRADRREAVHTAFLGDRIALATEPTDPNELILDWRKLSEPPPEKSISRDEARRAEADALLLALNTVFRH